MWGRTHRYVVAQVNGRIHTHKGALREEYIHYTASGGQVIKGRLE